MCLCTSVCLRQYLLREYKKYMAGPDAIADEDAPPPPDVPDSEF